LVVPGKLAVSDVVTGAENVSVQLPAVSVPEQLGPAAEVTVTSVLPVNGLPSFTAKLTVTFSGFVFGAVPVMVVVVDNGVALTVCVRLVAE
jgi:hypothetical protein